MIKHTFEDNGKLYSVDVPEVKVLKEKKGVPTVIEWNGKRYILHHADQLKR